MEIAIMLTFKEDEKQRAYLENKGRVLRRDLKQRNDIEDTKIDKLPQILTTKWMA